MRVEPICISFNRRIYNTFIYASWATYYSNLTNPYYDSVFICQTSIDSFDYNYNTYHHRSHACQTNVSDFYCVLLNYDVRFSFHFSFIDFKSTLLCADMSLFDMSCVETKTNIALGSGALDACWKCIDFAVWRMNMLLHFCGPQTFQIPVSLGIVSLIHLNGIINWVADFVHEHRMPELTRLPMLSHDMLDEYAVLLCWAHRVNCHGFHCFPWLLT